MLSNSTAKRSRESSASDTNDACKLSVYKALKKRSQAHPRSFGRTCRVSARSILPLFKSPNNLVYQFVFPDSEFCTPFYCDFSHYAFDGQLLAVGDEEGRLSLLRTDKDNDASNIDYHHSFYCHRHAITDVKWGMDDTMLITAANDRKVRLFDTETRKPMLEFSGHDDIVKSVNWHPTNLHLFVTSSKDGSFRIWDTRFNQQPASDPDDMNRVPVHKAIKAIPNAHSYSKPKPKSKSSSKTGPEPSYIRSVTSALFLNLDEEKVVTSGSSDGSIKLWDVRAGRSARVLASTVFEAKSGKRHGIADMKIDSSGKRLFSACKDNGVYMHYLTDLTRPALRFCDPDYMVGFDNRISLSPDDRFFLSGSADKDLFVWEVDQPQARAYRYEGHTKKVTGVSWNKQSINQFASCSEDFTARIWNVEY